MTKGKSRNLVLRRRRLWCFIGAGSFLLWFTFKFSMQQLQIMDREKELEQRIALLRSAEREQSELKNYLQKSKTDEYLLEASRNLGYGKRGECIYRFEN